MYIKKIRKFSAELHTARIVNDGDSYTAGLGLVCKTDAGQQGQINIYGYWQNQAAQIWTQLSQISLCKCYSVSWNNDKTIAVFYLFSYVKPCTSVSNKCLDTEVKEIRIIER